MQGGEREARTGASCSRPPGRPGGRWGTRRQQLLKPGAGEDAGGCWPGSLSLRESFRGHHAGGCSSARPAFLRRSDPLVGLASRLPASPGPRAHAAGAQCMGSIGFKFMQVIDTRNRCSLLLPGLHMHTRCTGAHTHTHAHTESARRAWPSRQVLPLTLCPGDASPAPRLHWGRAPWVVCSAVSSDSSLPSLCEGVWSPCSVLRVERQGPHPILPFDRPAL